MKTVTLYPYDSQLRPGDIGADFEDGHSNHAFTRRYDLANPEDLKAMLKHLLEWLEHRDENGDNAPSTSAPPSTSPEPEKD